MKIRFLALLLISLTACASLAAAAPIKLSDAEKQWLSSHRTVRVWVNAQYPPFLFVKDGQPQGICFDHLALVAERLGIELEYVTEPDWLEALDALRHGDTVDMVMAVAPTPEREEFLAFSKEYLSFPWVIFTRKDSDFIGGMEDLSGKTVAVPEGFVTRRLLMEKYPDIRHLLVTRPIDALRAVCEGRADAYVGNLAAGSYLIQSEGFLNLKIAAPSDFGNFGLAMGVRKGWAELAGLLDKGLDSISKEEKDGIRNKWLSVRYEHGLSPRDFLFLTLAAAAVILIVLTVLLVYYFWNKKLKTEIIIRKRTEAELREAHDTVNQLIESASIIVLGLDSQDRVKLVNKYCEELTGYRREELLNVNWFKKLVPPHRFPGIEEKITRIRQKDGSLRGYNENPILTKSGAVCHILWQNTSIPSIGGDIATLCFGVDITERRAAEKALRKSKAFLQGIFDAIQDGICVLSPDLRILTTNKTMKEWYAHEFPFEGRKCHDVYHQRREVCETCPAVRAIREKTLQSEIVPWLGASGMRGWLELYCFPVLDEHGRVTQIVEYVRDITERVKAEKLRQDVERMVQHDLKSPVIAMQTLYHLFSKADNLTESQQELLKSVRDSGKKMLSIIEMSRALFKMETGAYELSPKPVDLLPVIDCVAKENAGLTRRKHIELKVLVDGKSPAPQDAFIIEAEDILAYSLLANLIRNALEASPKGEAVSIRLTRSPASIAVSNSGEVPLEIRENFFDKYVTSGKRHGTGLGTYTAWRITRTLGGTIALDTSQKGRTTITVCLRDTQADS